MDSKRWNSLESLLRDLSDRLDLIERRSERMELILTLREPNSGAAADAYDGLRKQIIAGVTDRLAHLTQLVQFDEAVRNAASTEVLTSLVRGWVDASGLAIVADPKHDQADLLFTEVENLGGPPQVIDPAYVDSQSNRVIRRGTIRFGSPEPSSESSHPVDAPADPMLTPKEGDLETATPDEGNMT
jgi:hypothetical protein